MDNSDRALFFACVAVVLDAIGKSSPWLVGWMGIVSGFYAGLHAVIVFQRIRDRRRTPALGWYRHKLSRKRSEVVGIENNLVVVKPDGEEPFGVAPLGFYQMYEREREEGAS